MACETRLDRVVTEVFAVTDEVTYQR